MWREKEEREQASVDWSEDLDRLLHTGEEVEGDVAVGSSRVVVTTQRVMAFTPETADANFRYVDRPNAVGVERKSDGNTNALGIGGTLGATGILSVMVGSAMPDLGSLVSLPQASGAGTPGLGFAKSVLSLMSLIDTMFMALGALLIASGVLVFGYYLRTRRSLLAIRVAGDSDMELPLPEDVDADEALSRVRTAIEP